MISQVNLFWFMYHPTHCQDQGFSIVVDTLAVSLCQDIEEKQNDKTPPKFH